MKQYQTGGTTTASMLGQSSSLSPWAGPYVTDMLGKGAALSELPYQPYMGPLTAGQSGLQQQAFQGLANLAVPSTLTGGGMGAPSPYMTSSSPYPSSAQALSPMPTGGLTPTASYDDVLSRSGTGAPASIDRQTMAQGIASQGMDGSFGATPAGQPGYSLEDILGVYNSSGAQQPQSIASVAPQQSQYVNEPFFANKEDYDAWKANQAQQGMQPQGMQPQGMQPQGMQQQGAPTTQQQIASLMNPYIEQALNPQLEAAQRQAQIQAQNLQSQFGKAGAYGGSRQGVAEAELQRGLLDRMAGLTGQGYQQAYDKAVDLLGKERGYGLDVLAAQRQGGAEQRAIEGQGIAADIAQFEQERDYPYKQVQYMQSLLQGLPISTQSYQYAEPSTLSNVMGGASGILGLLETMGIFNKG